MNPLPVAQTTLPTFAPVPIPVLEVELEPPAGELTSIVPGVHTSAGRMMFTDLNARGVYMPLIVETFGPYRTHQSVTLAEPPLQNPRATTWNAEIGTGKDVLLERLIDAMKERFAGTASELALARIGSERGINRFSFEPLEVYRARVLGAFAYWEKAGTIPGLKLALEQAGWIVSIREHFRTNPSIWAEFSIVIRPKTSTIPLWDGFNWDSFNWDFSAPTLPVQYLKALIDAAKPAHAKLRDLELMPANGMIWNEFNWDDGSLWTETSSI